MDRDLKLRGAYHFHGKPGKFQLENQMVRIIPFGLLLKLWASGQSDAFLLLLLLMFIHFACYPSKLNHFVFMSKISIRVVCVNGKHLSSLHCVVFSYKEPYIVLPASRLGK